MILPRPDYRSEDPCPDILEIVRFQDCIEINNFGLFPAFGEAAKIPKASSNQVESLNQGQIKSLALCTTRPSIFFKLLVISIDLVL